MAMNIWQKRSNEKTGRYLREPKTKVLEFKPILIDRAKQGDREATNKLLELAYPYAIRRASWWHRMFPQLDVMDMAHAGIFGVYDAIRKYDPAKSSFLTYSYIWMDKRMRAHMRKELDADIPMGIGYTATTSTPDGEAWFERKTTSIGVLGTIHGAIGTYMDIVSPSKDLNNQDVFTDDLERAFWALNSLERECLYVSIIKGKETVAQFSKRYGHTRNWGWLLYHSAISKLRLILEQGRTKEAPCRQWR